MKPKHVYAILAVIGTVLPLWAFFPFLREHGFAPGTFFQQLFSTPVSSFFGTDVIVSAVVLWVLVSVDGRRVGMRYLWVPIMASLMVGVSLGLPLFLYMREDLVERTARAAEAHMAAG